MNWIKQKWAKLVGGRPMRLLHYYGLLPESNTPVYIYEDKFSKQWLARTGWDWLRQPFWGGKETTDVLTDPKISRILEQARE